MNCHYEEQSSETAWHINGEEYRLVRYWQPPRSRDEGIHFIHSVFGGRVADVERDYDAAFGASDFEAAVLLDIKRLPPGETA